MKEINEKAKKEIAEKAKKASIKYQKIRHLINGKLHSEIKMMFAENDIPYTSNFLSYLTTHYVIVKRNNLYYDAGIPLNLHFFNKAYNDLKDADIKRKENNAAKPDQKKAEPKKLIEVEAGEVIITKNNLKSNDGNNTRFNAHPKTGILDLFSEPIKKIEEPAPKKPETLKILKELIEKKVSDDVICDIFPELKG